MVTCFLEHSAVDYAGYPSVSDCTLHTQYRIVSLHHHHKGPKTWGRGSGYNAADLCLLSRFDKFLPKPKLCTSLKLLASMVAEVGVSIFGGGTGLIQQLPILVLKILFGKVYQGYQI